MNSELISVIIPIYEVEKYLRKCVDSVLAQTYKNLEIILVDDGSPDNCGKICDEYAKKDNRVKVIHKRNGGLSSARNAGLDIAKGELVGFVDSDDYISPCMYEKLHNVLKTEQTDLALCDLEYVNKDGPFTNKNVPALKKETLTREEALKKLHNIPASVNHKLYKKKIFNGLRFRDGALYEDQFILHHIFNRLRKATIIIDKLYFYLQHSNSITAKYKYDLDLVHALWERADFLAKLGMPKESHIALRGAYGNLSTIIKHLPSNEDRHKIAPIYRKILFRLLALGDLRAVKLFMTWHKLLREPISIAAGR